MNIWDSVHRGLEKASHEAARIARIQKLRTQIDGLSRQFNSQQSTLINRTMELFTSNQLTQNQLLPICSELLSIQQQLEQAQNELKQVQSQMPQPQQPQTPLPPVNTTTTYQVTSPYSGNEIPPTIYAPPPPNSDQQPYAAEQNAPVPPPPPGPQTISAMETLLLGATPTPPPPPAIPISIRCAGCHAEITSGLAFCPNCGRAVQENPLAHLPTMRGGTLEPFYPPGQETVRGENTNNIPGERVTGPGLSIPEHIADQATVRGESPPPATNPKEQDGGS
jgi:hypothetical protein